MSSENSSDSKHRQFIWKALAISPVAGYTLMVGGLLILHLVVSAILPPLFPGLTATTLNIMEAIIVSTLTAPLFWLLVVTPLEQSAVSEYVRSQAILGHIGEGVVTFSEEGVIESSNAATERLFGISGRLPGTMISSLFSENAATLLGAISEKKGPVTAPVEVIGLRRDGTSFPVELTISRMRQDDRNIGIAVIRSLSDKKKAEERLSYLTSYDPLTGLPNRSLVQDRLAQSLAHSERTGEKGCLIFLDLNNIKTVNETIGHGAGDELLQAAAEILSGWVREGDTVGRMSGNQFALILHDIAAVDAAREACGEILRLLGDQFTVAGRGVYLKVSLGIVLFPSDGNAVDPLLRKAEAALQHANRTGKNDFQFYSSEMNDRVSEKLALETSLRRAVENHELVLHYQPRLDLETGKIVAVEALARWADPVLGMVPPQKFIPLAEETGLIIGVGEWVLREACRQLAAWKREGIGDIKMSVNVSPMQLRQPDFSKTVQDILQENDIDPAVIELEVTETSAMENTEESIKGFQRLRDMGVGLAIDDFGTGYSSLSYLTRLPVDILKIDRSFVREIPACADGAAIARTIISMAHSLGLKVVAEGVESDDQMVFLRSHSCQEMQGFLFSTAVSPEKMAEMMRSHNAEEHERERGE